MNEKGIRETAGERAAAEAAGRWWAARLHPRHAEYRDVFAAAVAMRVAQALRGECYWDWFGERKEGRGWHEEPRCHTEFDYDPHFCLCEALDEAIPGISPMDMKECLPRKHDLLVYIDRLVPKEGYGNWTSEIAVKESK